MNNNMSSDLFKQAGSQEISSLFLALVELNNINKQKVDLLNTISLLEKEHDKQKEIEEIENINRQVNEISTKVEYVREIIKNDRKLGNRIISFDELRDMLK